MTINDETTIDYSQLGTSFDELVAPIVESWSPEVRQFGEELSQRFYFGVRLAELRQSLGLSQAEAGQLVGENQSEISRIEREQVVPSVDRAIRIFARLRSYAAAHKKP
jgi:DNA-binding XRE family transcriptional regulator